MIDWTHNGEVTPVLLASYLNSVGMPCSVEHCATIIELFFLESVDV
jgi:hypothetical protein